MFSENLCWQTKNIHNFLGDNTRFTPGIEAWSRETQKMGFRMDTKKKFRKEKGMTLYWPPVPTSRGTNQPKRHYRGRKPIKLHTWLFVSYNWSKSCRVPDRRVVCTSDCQVEGAMFDSRLLRYDRFKPVIEIVLHESLFQNYWFCLIKCMQMFNTFVVAYKVRPEVNPGPAVERASLCQLN